MSPRALHDPLADLGDIDGLPAWEEFGDPFTLVESFDGASSPTVMSAAKQEGAAGRVRSVPVVVADRFLVFGIAGTDFEFVSCVNVLVDGEIVRSDTGRGVERMRKTSVDLGPWIGREVQIEVCDTSGTQGWIAAAGFAFEHQRHRREPSVERYHEALRPRLHFTARQWAMDRPDPVERQEGWLNDLNGLVHFDGEYHLFAQRWNKCWIHAVSTDLLHWTELSPAFFEETLGSGVQSGSCVVDVDNTSGLGAKDGPPPMIAFWSGADNRSQCLSYSVDHGRTWIHHPGNPLMLRGERDPIVFRDRDRGRWCMVLYGAGRYELLISDDLLDWTPTGTILGDGFECPDFFELPIAGTDERRWVLVRGDGRYSVGAFDGDAFVPETGQLTIDPGPNFYATQSWDAPSASQSRRVQVAWMRGSVFPRMPFNQQVSIPCELELRLTPVGVRLHRQPVRELATLERQHHTWPSRSIAPHPDDQWLIALDRHVIRIRCDLEIDDRTTLELDACGTRIHIQTDAIAIGDSSQRTITPVRSLDVLVDTASVEVFANGGEASLTAFGFAGAPHVRFRATDGSVTVHDLSVAELESTWSRPATPTAPGIGDQPGE